ncbi:MAG: site-2 protease family protein [candidate division Zixibacteria bacterium]|nr:site-2 protease family protein [candidate division Zixibacteria bacterium]
MWKRKKIEIQNQIQTIREALYDILEVQTIYYTRKDIFIKVFPYLSIANWKEIVESRLSSLGYFVEFEQLDPAEPAGPVILHIGRLKDRRKTQIPWTNIILFLLTVITTLLAGAYMNQADPLSNPLFIFKGASFAVPLLLILTFHEFGHYIESRINGIKVSLPYFIPGPTLFGTFGAVIRSKSPFKTRRDLLDVGAAGPIAGFVVAVIVVIIGLSHSQIVEEVPGEGLILGESLIFKFLSWMVLKDVPQGHTVLLSPAAFAGWAGILVTMLNLLPIGQLDGGHIMYALLGKNQRKVATVATLALIPLGFFLWMGWFVWVALVLLIKIGHPPTLNDQVPLDTKRKVIGWLSMFIFILSFIPVPIK